MSARRLTPLGAPSPEALFSPLAEYPIVGLAVSGGPDSLALMLLAAAYARARAAPRFIVYTVDHGLRPEAADEAAFVVREAERLGFPARALRWEGRKPRTRVQEQARAARYRLIGEAMRADRAEVLVTAHHLDDQAETVLMRLAHGSGLAGLGGMRAMALVEGVVVARPLLGTERSVLHRVVADAAIVPVVDPGNDDARYERVRWRRIMPQLAALGLDARRIAAFAARSAAASEAVTAAGAAALVDLGARDPSGRTVTIGREGFGRLAPAVAIALLARVVTEVGDRDRPVDLAAIEALFADLEAGLPVPRRTLHGCFIGADARTIRIEPEPLKGARARRAAQRNA